MFWKTWVRRWRKWRHEVLFLVCRPLFADGKYDEAIHLLRRHIRKERHPAPSAWCWLGAAYAYSSCPDEAIPYLTIGLGRFPDYGRLQVLLACCLLQTDKPQLALQEFDAGMANVTDEDAVWLLAWWCHAACQAGSPAEQTAVYEMALRHDPDNPHALHAYAIWLAGAPDADSRDGPRSIALPERVCIGQSWADWKSVTVLAAAYAEAGDFETAAGYATMAHEMAPDDEKPTRKERIDQYWRGEPFRLDPRQT